MAVRTGNRRRHRDKVSGAKMDTSPQGINYGIPMAAKSPGLAAIAILTLAPGIGASIPWWP